MSVLLGQKTSVDVSDFKTFQFYLVSAWTHLAKNHRFDGAQEETTWPFVSKKSQQQMGTIHRCIFRNHWKAICPLGSSGHLWLLQQNLGAVDRNTQ